MGAATGVPIGPVAEIWVGLPPITPDSGATDSGAGNGAGIGWLVALSGSLVATGG